MNGFLAHPNGHIFVHWRADSFAALWKKSEIFPDFKNFLPKLLFSLLKWYFMVRSQFFTCRRFPPLILISSPDRQFLRSKKRFRWIKFHAGFHKERIGRTHMSQISTSAINQTSWAAEFKHRSNDWFENWNIPHQAFSKKSWIRTWKRNESQTSPRKCSQWH